MSSARLGIIALAVVAGFITHGARCFAQEEEGDARMHFRLGAAYYDSGRFAEAAHEFELSYQLSQRPQLLQNMFVAYRDAGDMPNAIHALREYLRLVPDAPDRENLQARLTVMERQQAEHPGTAETDTPPDPGQPEHAPPPPSESGGMWMPGWIIAGVGAAAVIAGVITGALALGEQSSLDAMCDADHSCDAGFEGTRDSAALLAGLTDGFLIGGGVLAVLGIVLAVTVPTGESNNTASLTCTGTGCMARVEF